MLVGVKDNFATHFHSKIVQGFEAFRMHRGGFMRNQDVSLAFLEFFIDTLENRRTVSAGKTAAPHSALADLSDEKAWRSIKRHCRRHPNLAAEYTA